MKDEMLRKQIHQAVDHHARNARPDPFLAQRIMALERKEIPVKKRYSIGFIVLMILILTTATALAAALLGGKDFVDQIMAPKAAQTDSDSFTKEEIDEILRIAAENDLTLSDQDMYTLTHLEETGYFKEELMRRFVKTEYGFYPDAWPIEVQHWYEEMLEACGLDDGVIVNVLPEGDEYTQERILKIAQDFIHEKYDPDVDLDDPDKYLRFLTYRESRLGEDMTSRQWSLTYEARDLYGADYLMTLDTAGHIKNEYRADGIMGASWEARGQFMMDRFIRVYGDAYGAINWNSEILLKYQQAMEHRQTLTGPEHFLDKEYPILYMTYLLADDTMLSRDAAIEKAKEACGSLDWETLYSNSAVAVCMENPEGKPVWKVTLRLHGGGYVFSQLDAHTGEALITDTGNTDEYRGWRQYVTEEYWQKEKPVRRAADNRETAQPVPAWRLPAFWGDTDVAPAWYWEKLNAVGCDSEEAEEALYEGWVEKYGYDTHFWPLEAQAIEKLLQFNDETDSAAVDFPGLPTVDDISQEEALRLAKAAFKEEYADELPGLDVSVLKGAFSYYMHCVDEDRNAWVVYLYRTDGVLAGAVWLESTTGEAYELESTDPTTPGLRGRPLSFSKGIPTPTPLPNGRPWMWGMDFAPQEYWDRLEQVMAKWGVTPENYNKKHEEWEFQYGNEIFFPYDCLVIRYILEPTSADLWTEEKPQYILFPKEGDLTRAQAEAIARKAVHEAGDGEVDAAYIDDLKCCPLLWANPSVDGLYQAEQPLWCVFFFAWDDTYGDWTQRASAYITEDGEVILAQMDLASNG